MRDTDTDKDEKIGNTSACAHGKKDKRTRRPKRKDTHASKMYKEQPKRSHSDQIAGERDDMPCTIG